MPTQYGAVAVRFDPDQPGLRDQLPEAYLSPGIHFAASYPVIGPFDPVSSRAIIDLIDRAATRPELGEARGFLTSG